MQTHVIDDDDDGLYYLQLIVHSYSDNIPRRRKPKQNHTTICFGNQYA
jgi:hypothetical protein